MARRICVQPSLLGIMATSGEPSTWLPLGELEGQEPLPLLFSRKFEIFKKISSFFNFLKKFGSYITLKFQSHFHTLIPFLWNFNVSFKTITAFTRPLVDSYFFKNYFFMVEFTAVRWSLLARLATVLVWQRAVNRQPSFHREDSSSPRPRQNLQGRSLLKCGSDLGHRLETCKKR